MIVAPRHNVARHTRRAAFTLLEVLVVVAILVILASAASISVFRYLDDAKINTARNTMTQFETQCRAFAANNGGNPPESLLELVQPSDGGRAFIEGGPSVLIDPWGQQYQYNPENYDQTGNQDPIVFTTVGQGGRTIYRTRRK